MEWEYMVAIAVMIPILVLPVGFVWYLNVAGFVRLLRGKRVEKAEKVGVTL